MFNNSHKIKKILIIKSHQRKIKQEQLLYSQ